MLQINQHFTLIQAPVFLGDSWVRARRRRKGLRVIPPALTKHTLQAATLYSYQKHI